MILLILIQSHKKVLSRISDNFWDILKNFARSKTHRNMDNEDTYDMDKITVEGRENLLE